MRSTHHRSLFVVSALSFLLVGHSLAQFTYAPIDVACTATCPNGLTPDHPVAPQTSAVDINPAGEIVGWYRDLGNKPHGFVYSNAQFTTVDVPGSAVGREDIPSLPTFANGINAGGDIVGSFTSPVNTMVTDVSSPKYCPAGGPACIKGFLYTHHQFFVLPALPNPDGSGIEPGSIAERISPDGDIFGCIHAFDMMDSMHAAAWSRHGSVSLDLSPSMANGATPGGGMVVGLWDQPLPTNPPSFHRHGFVMRDGVLQQYDVASSSLTAIWGANPGEAFVGTYVSTGQRHGFLQLPDASAPPASAPWASTSAINIDYPNSSGTIALSIDVEGVIVGQYFTTAGQSHGFAAIPTTTN